MNYQNLTLETERLLLIPIDMKYAEEIFREFQEPVTKYVYSKAPEKIEETKTFIKAMQEGMQKGTDIVMVILKKDTREFLGCCGIHHLDQKNPEMGIWTKKSAHGHKYGREAVSKLQDWAVENLEFDHIIFAIVAENIASRKIAESLGGKIKKEYQQTMLSGRIYDMVEYWVEK